MYYYQDKDNFGLELKRIICYNIFSDQQIKINFIEYTLNITTLSLNICFIFESQYVQWLDISYYYHPSQGLSYIGDNLKNKKH